MADIYSDGMVRVAWVPSISTISAPTTTELGAGILLQTLLTASGIGGFEADTAGVENGSLASTTDTETIGRDSFKGNYLELKKQTGTDTAYTTLTRGATGFVVIRRDLDQATAWASSQAVEVYPVICGSTKKLKPEANSLSRYQVPMFVTSAPNLRASIA